MDNSICLNEISNLLKKKVSSLNAKILLDSAVSLSGLQVTSEEPLTKEQIESLCLKMISKGGPSFQVGREVYSKYAQ